MDRFMSGWLSRAATAMQPAMYLQFTKQYVLAALKQFEWPVGPQQNCRIC
jgi:hypothetical protein